MCLAVATLLRVGERGNHSFARIVPPHPGPLLHRMEEKEKKKKHAEHVLHTRAAAKPLRGFAWLGLAVLLFSVLPASAAGEAVEAGKAKGLTNAEPAAAGD